MKAESDRCWSISEPTPDERLAIYDTWLQSRLAEGSQFASVREIAAVSRARTVRSPIAWSGPSRAAERNVSTRLHPRPRQAYIPSKGARRRVGALALVAALALLVVASLPIGSAFADTPATPLPGLRMMNYFPAKYPQGAFWTPTNWVPTTYAADFALIHALGGNTVRIFVPSDQFGFPTLRTPYPAELSKIVSLAAQNGLKVYLNIFNYNGHFSDIDGSKQWASALLQPYAGDSRLAAVEVFNEIDPTNVQAMSWAQKLIPYVRQVVQRPVSISTGGWANVQSLGQLFSALGSSQPDFYDWHYYCTAGDAKVSLINQAVQSVSPTPMIIGESGWSTGLKQTSTMYVSALYSSGEQQQVTYYQQLSQALAQVPGVGLVSPWDLYDYAPTPGSSTTAEDYFGLYRLDGSAKPAVSTLKSAWA